MKSLWFAAAVLAAAPLVSAEDDPTPAPPPRELSLAERAEAAKKHAEASGKGRDSRSGGKVLNNEDLKKAKGNVIYLQAAINAGPSRVSASTPLADTSASSAETIVPVARIPAGTSGDLVRELDESRGRAIRLRATIDETQRALAEASAGEGRTALEERLRSTLNELLQTQEAIGVLSERMRQSDPVSSPKDKP